MWIISIFLWLICFSIDKGSNVKYSFRGGGGGDDDTPAQVDPAAQARANVSAQVESIPRAAQLQFDVLNDPNFGALATSQLFENIRQQVFPGEQGVREQLTENILQSLVSPTGLSPEQQGAIESRRDIARGELTESQRTRANLGGGLFGGRSAAAEARSRGELESGFVESDIARDERNRLNSLQSGLSILQLLFPQSGIQTPQFINPVVGADTQFSGAVGQREQDIQAQQQQQASQNALLGSLFQGLGTAAGGALGGPIGAGIGRRIGGAVPTG